MRLIDADALVSLVNDATILGDGFKQAFVAIVNGEPTVEPERKTGKWVKYNGKFYYDWTCSECDSCSHERTDYCPMCGAKMEVEA